MAVLWQFCVRYAGSSSMIQEIIHCCEILTHTYIFTLPVCTMYMKHEDFTLSNFVNVF